MKKRRNKVKEVWNKLFPLRAGVKVVLLARTPFQGKRRYYLPKGTKGIVVLSSPYSSFAFINFKYKEKEYLCYLKKDRVEVDEEEENS